MGFRVLTDPVGDCVLFGAEVTNEGIECPLVWFDSMIVAKTLTVGDDHGSYSIQVPGSAKNRETSVLYNDSPKNILIPYDNSDFSV